MKTEWRVYWIETLKSTRSVFLALGVSLVIWLFQIPRLDQDEYVRSLLISCTYGVTIFFTIWALYALAWAMVTQINLKRGAKSFKLTWGVHIALSFTGMSGGFITAKWLTALWRNRPFTTDGLLEGLMIGSFISLMFLFFYAYKHQAQENAQLRAAKAESELHVLKNQMQPHFLFNSLNSLTELIETNKDSAASMTLMLSDLYREILESSKLTLISLDRELSIIQKYLALESLRFGERLSFEIESPAQSERAQIFIPPLIVQTLVENAVKHGIGPSRVGGKISVRLTSQENAKGERGYRLCVSNTGQSELVSNKSGTGLKNTRARLDLLYGQKHDFQMKSGQGQTQVSFWFSGEALNA